MGSPSGWKKAIRDRKKRIFLHISLICCGILLLLCSLLAQELLFIIAGIPAILIGLERLFLLPKIGLKKQYALILKS